MEASVDNPQKPLFSVPMLAIDKCERVNLDLEVHSGKIEPQKELLKNQFEVIFKENFLPLYLDQNYEAIMTRASDTQILSQRDQPSIEDLIEQFRNSLSSPSSKSKE